LAAGIAEQALILLPRIYRSDRPWAGNYRRFPSARETIRSDAITCRLDSREHRLNDWSLAMNRRAF